MTEQSGLPTGDDETRAFRRQFGRLIEDLTHGPDDDDVRSESLRAVLSRFLGEPAARLAVVAEEVPPHRMVDVDIALTDLVARDPEANLIGIAGDMRHHSTLGDLIQHSRVGRVGQVDYRQMETGPGADDRRQVVTSGIHLFTFDGSKVAVRVQAANPQFGRETGNLEVLASERAVSDALIEQVRIAMERNSVFRGKVITFGFDPYGRAMAGVTFVERPSVNADEVILPPGELERVRQHVVGIGEARERLRASGQHLKRGVLLYGPPGTGKTHTVRHLLSATPGTTAILLSGGALSQIHAAAKVARAHQPAIVVLEDVDLVAEDRSMGMGTNPLLFEVLDALDGLDADADVAFLLTTNRVRSLERALSQRPGRVDLAVEIPLPDEDGRLALLRLYAAGLFSDAALVDAAARTAGTTASFSKELVRRAVLRAALNDSEPGDGDLSGALDDLLSDGETLTRSLLGSGGRDADGIDGADGPGGGFGEPPSGVSPAAYPAPPAGGAGASFGWFGHAPGGAGGSEAYGSALSIQFDDPGADGAVQGLVEGADGGDGEPDDRA